MVETDGGRFVGTCNSRRFQGQKQPSASKLPLFLLGSDKSMMLKISKMKIKFALKKKLDKMFQNNL